MRQNLTLLGLLSAVHVKSNARFALCRMPLKVDCATILPKSESKVVLTGYCHLRVVYRLHFSLLQRLDLTVANVIVAPRALYKKLIFGSSTVIFQIYVRCASKVTNKSVS